MVEFGEEAGWRGEVRRGLEGEGLGKELVG